MCWPRLRFKRRAFAFRRDLHWEAGGTSPNVRGGTKAPESSRYRSLRRLEPCAELGRRDRPRTQTRGPPLFFPSDLGQTDAMTQRVLEELSMQDCFDLLASGRVGRLVYVDEQGPVAIPVNYAMAGADIVFRVEQGTKRAALEQPVVAFEVDHIDEGARSAWSVIVRGAAYEVDVDRVPELLGRMGGHPPVPWAIGIHNVWLRVVASGVTGRRLGAPGSSLGF